MIDITHKANTLRTATAEATVKVGTKATMDAIKNKAVPKGDVLEMARTAGLFGVKKTAELIPDCHPMPIEGTSIAYVLGEMELKIHVSVTTIYKTGVEVEAMHGASIVALTIYDMLKPIDKEVSIANIKLLKKKGGKSSYQQKVKITPNVWLVTCNDLVADGKKQDTAANTIAAQLADKDIPVAVRRTIAQKQTAITEQLRLAQEAGANLLIFTGGTGLGVNDILPETIRPLLTRAIPGMEEAMRQFGQQRTPYAMIARSVAGLVDNMLVLGLPGSTNGAKESMEALFPGVLHALVAIRQKS